MTADLLRVLLTEDDSYRRRWRAHMDRTPVSDLQHSAVARVLAEHLWESGQVEEADEQLPRRLKDTVARALRGSHLSPRTLRWFVEAFAFSQRDRALLWESLELELATHPAALVPEPDPPSSTDPDDGAWEATLLHEQVSMTPHGRVARRRVELVVRALEPLTRVRLPGVRGAVSVVARRGVAPGPVPTGPDPVTLVLPEPLTTGEVTLLEYDLVPLDPAPLTEVRTSLERVGAGGTVILQVRFHPERLPERVWSCRWSEQAEDVRRVTGLGPWHDVQQVVSGLRSGALGFSWRW